MIKCTMTAVIITFWMLRNKRYRNFIWEKNILKHILKESCLKSQQSLPTIVLGITWAKISNKIKMKFFSGRPYIYNHHKNCHYSLINLALSLDRSGFSRAITWESFVINFNPQIISKVKDVSALWKIRSKKKTAESWRMS